MLMRISYQARVLLQRSPLCPMIFLFMELWHFWYELDLHRCTLGSISVLALFGMFPEWANRDPRTCLYIVFGRVTVLLFSHQGNSIRHMPAGLSITTTPIQPQLDANHIDLLWSFVSLLNEGCPRTSTVPASSPSPSLRHPSTPASPTKSATVSVHTSLISRRILKSTCRTISLIT